MGIVTKKGDAGQTSLYGGERVPKSDVRVEAYGTLDELGAFIGILYDTIQDVEYRSQLMVIQKNLMVIEAFMSGAKLDFSEERITQLETFISQMEGLLEPLREFVIPGGNLGASYAHVCRTVCRRAERRAVAAGFTGAILRFINRLSDYFFELSRVLCL